MHMDKLDQYRVFVRVAEMGSVIKAAHALELPRASVSAAIQQLEEKIGARLLNRTTRQVHLTADGTRLLERLRPLLADVEDVEQLFQSSQRQVFDKIGAYLPEGRNYAFHRTAAHARGCSCRQLYRFLV